MWRRLRRTIESHPSRAHATGPNVHALATTQGRRWLLVASRRRQLASWSHEADGPRIGAAALDALEIAEPLRLEVDVNLPDVRDVHRR